MNKQGCWTPSRGTARPRKHKEECLPQRRLSGGCNRGKKTRVIRRIPGGAGTAAIFFVTRGGESLATFGCATLLAASHVKEETKWL